ncbi:MAG: phosphodiester glycosidase family protein [Clostridia bacterium]|nr:phosphodiester glycosidase family protein [Clostridia bacterium]
MANNGNSRDFAAKVGKLCLRSLIIVGITLILLIAALYTAMFVMVNGPSPTVGKLFVLSLKETSAGGFLADWYMSEEEIAALQAEKAEEEAAEINTALIKLPEREDISDLQDDVPSGEDTDSDTGDEAEEIKNERLEGIEIHDVSGGTYNGKMLIVKDPTRVFVGVPDRYGEGASGLSLTKMIEKYDAVGGTNAGGFIDPNGSGTGGIPEGIVISDGELLWGELGTSYSLAGLDEKGLLYVGKMTGARAMELGLQYAVSYGPALIINGEPCNSKRSLGGGINPRTAIGQREDGAILLLVVNGRQIDSLGATLDDLIEIMLSFGAVNASNLDGGSSTLMKLDGEYLNTSSYILGGERVLASTILID